MGSGIASSSSILQFSILPCTSAHSKSLMESVNAFKHILHVLPSDIDDMGHVNNVVYVRWVQDVAAAHWKDAASPALQVKYAWVVLRHEIDYRNPAFLTDEIAGYTWVGNYSGARFERFVKLMSGIKVLAEAKTTWCLLDSKSLRPIRIPDEITSLL